MNKRTLVMALIFAVLTVSGCDEDEQPTSGARTREIKPTCRDFEILSCTWYLHEYKYKSRPGWSRYICIQGEVENVGHVAAIGEIEFIARDRNGTLIESATRFLNSYERLPPGSSCGFEYNIYEATTVSRFKTAEVRIVKVRK